MRSAVVTFGLALVVIGCGGGGVSVPGSTQTSGSGGTNTTTAGGGNPFAGSYTGTAHHAFWDNAQWIPTGSRPALGSVNSAGTISLVSLRSDGRNTTVSGTISQSGAIQGQITYPNAAGGSSTIGIDQVTFTAPFIWLVQYSPGGTPSRVQFVMNKNP